MGRRRRSARRRSKQGVSSSGGGGGVEAETKKLPLTITNHIVLQYLQKVETDRERRRSSEVSEERADEAEDAQTRRELDFD